MQTYNPSTRERCTIRELFFVSKYILYLRFPSIFGFKEIFFPRSENIWNQLKLMCINLTEFVFIGSISSFFRWSRTCRKEAPLMMTSRKASGLHTSMPTKSLNCHFRSNSKHFLAFCKMVWEQNAQVIIMITYFFENGKVRECTELELFFKSDILWCGYSSN